MSTLHTQIAAYHFNRPRTLAVLEKIEQEQDPQSVLAWRPGPGRAHIAWQLMHIGITEELFATERLVPGAKPAFADLVPRFKGSSTPDDEIPQAALIRTVLSEGLAGIVLAILLGYQISLQLKRWLDRRAGGPLQRAKNRITTFLSVHPDWHLRLYQTPNGLRLLAMHATFDPNEPVVPEFFRAIGTDPIYAQMCLRQHCFRARISPKPWRIGINEHLRPRPGVWPINPDRLPERRQWIADYDKAAKPFASCRYLESLGSSNIHPAPSDVQRIHDELCQANVALPLA